MTGNSLEVSAAGAVSLPDTNAVPLLAGQVTGSQNSFLFRDDGLNLTVDSVGPLLETGTGTPPNNQMLSVAGLSGVTTNAGNIILETTTSGNLVLSQMVNANNGSAVLGPAPGLIGLSSAGTITEVVGDGGNGLIVGGGLEAVAVNAVSLPAANRLGANDAPASASGVAGISGLIAGEVLASGQTFLARDERAGLAVSALDVADSFDARQLNPRNSGGAAERWGFGCHDERRQYPAGDDHGR